MKVIHVSEIPPELTKIRDNWRYFWSKVPVLGELYRRFVYHKRMNEWLDENRVDAIIH